MNKNSTQKEIRNFVSKISDFLKIVPVLAADLPFAGSLLFVLHNIPGQLQPVSKSIIPDSFNFLNNRQPQLRLKPVVIDQF